MGRQLHHACLVANRRRSQGEQTYRGWTSVDAKVGGGRPFRFVNTHLEAFDNQPPNSPSDARAGRELVDRGGPATGSCRSMLVGDLNSDVKTEVKPGDGQAYRRC